MSRGRTVDESRIGEYWDWVTVALFLLVTVDLLTSLAAAEVVGRSAEGNPLMRWLLGRSLGVVVAVHLGVVVLVSVTFHVLMGRLRRTSAPQSRYFALLLELWLGSLVAVGLAVFANNLAVIVLGRSLL
ncbi:hypothetical protein ACFQJD_06265 [Haloplanus sp. GCM10025708]|uniref:hypothetical protein n=1 Tax=Haloferacaceae TaxID=1644056 RepID=UPI00361E2AD7